MEKQSITAIETMSGSFVDIISPKEETICIEDISWALSRQSRYIGHNSGELYSVAEHSFLVEVLVREALHKIQNNTNDDLVQSLTNWLNLQLPKSIYERVNVICLHALMHDSTEAYLVDVPSPVKKCPVLKIPYAELEANLEKVIHTALNIPAITEIEKNIIKWADRLALRIEAFNMMPSKGENWSIEFPLFSEEFSQIYFRPISNWREVHSEFIHFYNFLIGATK